MCPGKSIPEDGGPCNVVLNVMQSWKVNWESAGGKCTGHKVTTITSYKLHSADTLYWPSYWRSVVACPLWRAAAAVLDSCWPKAPGLTSEMSS